MRLGCFFITISVLLTGKVNILPLNLAHVLAIFSDGGESRVAILGIYLRAQFFNVNLTGRYFRNFTVYVISNFESLSKSLLKKQCERFDPPAVTVMDHIISTLNLKRLNKILCLILSGQLMTLETHSAQEVIYLFKQFF